MFCLGEKQARKYKNPILVAKCRLNPKNNLYVVKEQLLPCDNQGTPENPLELLTKKEIFKLKTKYKVSGRLMHLVEKCYQNTENSINLGDECKSLSGRIFVESLETMILDKLKKNIVCKQCKWIPYYNPENVSKFNNHTFLCGPSAAGKSTLCTEILKHNFDEVPCTIWAFGPMIKTDKAFRDLQKQLTRRKVKLVNSSEISAPLDLAEITTKNKLSILVNDDPDSQGAEQEFISDLTNKVLFHGRHKNILAFVIAHDPFSRRVSHIKASSIECSRIVLYPSIGKHICTKVMKNRLNMPRETIDRIYQSLPKGTRWMMIQNSNPCLVLTETSALLL